MTDVLLIFRNEVDKFASATEANDNLRAEYKKFFIEHFDEAVFTAVDSQPRTIEYDPNTGVLRVTVTIVDMSIIPPSHSAGMYFLEHGAGNWKALNI